MKMIWKTVLDITKTSPMYFEGALIKENQTLKYYFFDNWVGVSEIALDIKMEFSYIPKVMGMT